MYFKISKETGEVESSKKVSYVVNLSYQELPLLNQLLEGTGYYLLEQDNKERKQRKLIFT